MPYDDEQKKEPDEKSEEPDGGLEEEKFSFLQATVKPKPVTRKRILIQLTRVGIYGLIFGTFACLGFFALKPWAQSAFQGDPKTVTIPEDEEADTSSDEASQESEAMAPALTADNYKEMMKKVYEVAKEADKCVVSVQAAGVNDTLSAEGHGTEGSVAGFIVADNGQEILILCDNSVCADAKSWKVTFSDDSQYGATLKKQDRNSGLAVFGIARGEVSTTTWNAASVAVLGNSNLVTRGDAVIALGNTFGYAGGVGYGIISSNKYEEILADGERSILTTDIAAAADGTGILFNLNGEVIGMIDCGIWEAKETSTVKALAISDLKATIELLVNGQSVPYVGVYGTTINEAISEEQDMPTGIYVTQVNPDSPAMAAGIQNGDILQMVGDTKLTNTLSYEKAIMESRVGESVKIVGKRRGANGYVDIDFTVTVGSQE